MSCDQETALNNLRTFNYAFLINSTTIGRSSGNNIKFYSEDKPNNPTYEDYKLRRKTEILQYNTDNNHTNKKKISSIMKGNNYNRLSNKSSQNYFYTNSNINNYPKINNTLILTNNNNNTCSSLNTLLKSTRNSNVPSYDFLYYNTDIPYHKNI